MLRRVWKVGGHSLFMCLGLSAQLMEQSGRLVAVLCLLTCLGCF